MYLKIIYEGGERLYATDYLQWDNSTGVVTISQLGEEVAVMLDRDAIGYALSGSGDVLGRYVVDDPRA